MVLIWDIVIKNMEYSLKVELNFAHLFSAKVLNCAVVVMAYGVKSPVKISLPKNVQL